MLVDVPLFGPTPEGRMCTVIDAFGEPGQFPMTIAITAMPPWGEVQQILLSREHALALLAELASELDTRMPCKLGERRLRLKPLLKRLDFPI
jgi:hypothetical protein